MWNFNGRMQRHEGAILGEVAWVHLLHVHIHIYIYATSRVIKQYIIQVGVPQSGSNLKLCKDIVSVSDPICYMLTLPWLRGPLGTWSFPAWRAVCRESRTSSTERPGWDPGDRWACRAHGGLMLGLRVLAAFWLGDWFVMLGHAARSFLTIFLDQSQHVHLKLPIAAPRRN